MSGRQESLADAVIRSTDWASFELFNGTADGFGELLAAFIAADESRTADDLWDTMDNRVFAQDDIFSAAEPTIEVLLAALSEPRSRTAWIGILDLLFHLVQPASYRGDELGGRCLMVAAQGDGFWSGRRWRATHCYEMPAWRYWIFVHLTALVRYAWCMVER